MKVEKPDRRLQRTQQLLERALVALMLEKRYDKITVQDILNRADVGRSTFYAHYQDKEDLLVKSVERMLDALSHHIDHETGRSQYMIPALGLFRHIRNNRSMYEALVWGHGIELLFARVHVYLREQIAAHLASQLPSGQEPVVPLPVAADYLAGALLTLLRWWLDNKMPYPPERMAEIFEQLAMPGVTAGLEVQV